MEAAVSPTSDNINLVLSYFSDPSRVSGRSELLN
jgi:hypothetical protein